MSENEEVTKKTLGRPRKVEPEKPADPMMEVMKQIADQTAATMEMMGRILGDQEARKKSEEEKERKLESAIRFSPPPDYENRTWDHIDPREEMERALAPHGHVVGAIQRSKGDTLRVPPLMSDSNHWTSLCINCGLSIFFRWMGRPANDPKVNDPRAKKIITGFMVGGQAFQHNCAHAMQLAKMDMSPVINKDAMRPVLESKV